MTVALIGHRQGKRTSAQEMKALWIGLSVWGFT